jgi:hypothetical protein
MTQLEMQQSLLVYQLISIADDLGRLHCFIMLVGIVLGVS